jgi:RNA polymerase sigma factor (sigma-70 family)
MSSAIVLPETRHSLLMRLVDSADLDAWKEFTEIYEAAIYRYARHRGLQDADAREVVQQVLVAVHQSVAKLTENGQPAGFRPWLFETARRQCLSAIRLRKRFDRAQGGSGEFGKLQGVHSPAEALDNDDAISEQDDRAWAFSWAATQIEHEVAPGTWKAFWLTAVEGIPAATVAELLQMSIGNVYVAKCRIVARIRERVHDLLDSHGDPVALRSKNSAAGRESDRNA